MERRIIVLLSLLLTLLLSCHASAAGGTQARRRHTSPLARHQRVITAEAAATAAATGVPAMVKYETRYYTQRLDHFNAAPASYRTFQQRYLVNATYWGGKTAPIFVYAGNEGNVELFTNNTGFMWELAPSFRAMLVFIEHRYYGHSVPFGSEEAAFRNTSTAGYLTTTQAVADYATLVQSLKSNLSAHAAPVIVFGGSYGGMLAAWMRMKYPHVVIGAIASSAPILSFYGLAEPYAFYDIISNDFKSESQNCHDVLMNSWKELDKALSNEAGRAKLNSTFKMCRASSVDAIPNLLDTAIVYSAMTDYPTESGFLTPLPPYPVKAICRAIDHPSAGKDTFSRINDAMMVYYNYTGHADCLGDAEENDPYGMYDGWDWQACTEMILMSYGIRNGSVLPPEPFNFTEVLDGCRASTGLPPRPYWITTEFGGFDIAHVLKRTASNIVFFNGLRDPWSSGGVLKSISKSVIALVEPKGSHHVDLRFSSKEDPDWLKQVRVKETRIIAHWLRQYYKDEAMGHK
ncbi:lysosomal Pro-X carboxypeptidase-like [Lolium rigidum]|uniref:lysosomal Pro-X carboxypeptidase-like n=1 Tax=Lolium rigidum TaxID=89674 RepID=UPI001F5C7E6B|nr:lysosomal Pro-X carboxypeptidase-like [Lolium rigidum]